MFWCIRIAFLCFVCLLITGCNGSTGLTPSQTSTLSTRATRNGIDFQVTEISSNSEARAVAASISDDLVAGEGWQQILIRVASRNTNPSVTTLNTPFLCAKIYDSGGFERQALVNAEDWEVVHPPNVWLNEYDVVSKIPLNQSLSRLEIYQTPGNLENSSRCDLNKGVIWEIDLQAPIVELESVSSDLVTDATGVLRYESPGNYIFKMDGCEFAQQSYFGNPPKVQIRCPIILENLGGYDLFWHDNLNNNPTLVGVDSDGNIISEGVGFYKRGENQVVAPGMVFNGYAYFISYGTPVSQAPEWIELAFDPASSGMVTDRTRIILPPTQTLRIIETQEDEDWWWDK
jgi:hypothetical protein